MNKKSNSTINFIGLLLACLLTGILIAAKIVGGVGVLFENLSPTYFGIILGVFLRTFFLSFLLAYGGNDVLNIIRKKRGELEKHTSYLLIWGLFLVVAGVQVGFYYI